MTTFVVACITLLTVPPLPAPSSFRTIKSSFLRSSLNSSPISSVSALLLSAFPIAPGACASPSDELGCFGGGGAFKARPLTFFLFRVLALNGSDIVLIVDIQWSEMKESLYIERYNNQELCRPVNGTLTPESRCMRSDAGSVSVVSQAGGYGSPLPE